MHLAGEGFGRFLGGDANCFSGAEVHEGSRHLAPVAKFQRAFSQATAGHYRHRIGGAAINFHESYELLAVLSLRIFDAQLLQAKHGEAHAEDLTGANVAVSDFSIVQVIVERFHSKLSSFLTMNTSGQALSLSSPAKPGSDF